jgi:hypothetical protein
MRIAERRFQNGVVPTLDEGLSFHEADVAFTASKRSAGQVRLFRV